MLPSLENLSLSVPKFAKNPVCRTDALIDDLVHPGHGNLDLIDYVLEMATRPEPNEGPTEQALSMCALVDSLSAVASCLRNIGLWQMVAVRLEIPGAATRPNATTAHFALNRQWVIDWCHKIRDVGSATSEALTALSQQSPEGDVAAAWLLKRGADACKVLPRACYYGREDGFDAMVQALGGTANVDAIARGSAVIMAFERGNEPMARVAIDALAPVDTKTVNESIHMAAMLASTPLLQLLVPLTRSGVADEYFLKKALRGAVRAGAWVGGPVAAIATVVALGAQPPSSRALTVAGLMAIRINHPVALRALDATAGGFVVNDLIFLCELAAHEAYMQNKENCALFINRNKAVPLEYMRQATACLEVLLSARVPANNWVVSAALENISHFNNECSDPFFMLHFFETVAALQTLAPLVYTPESREIGMISLFRTIRPGSNFLNALFRCAYVFLYPPGGERLAQMHIDTSVEYIRQLISAWLAEELKKNYRSRLNNHRVLPDVPTLRRLINVLYSRIDIDEPLAPGLSGEWRLRVMYHILNGVYISLEEAAPYVPQAALYTARVLDYRDLFPPPTPPYLGPSTIGAGIVIDALGAW